MLIKKKIPSKIHKITRRVVLFISRSRAGKTTIKKILVDPTETNHLTDLSSDKNEPTVTSLLIHDKDMVLDLIDTPGILERRRIRESSQKRDDATIFQLITNCVNMEITKIHLFCFVAPFSAFQDEGHDDDFRAIETWIHHLGTDIQKNACLIITRSERKKEDDLKVVINDIKTSTYFKSIANVFKKGILFTGALNEEDWKRDPRNLYDQFEFICVHRQQLIDLFSSNIEPYDIKELKFSHIKQLSERLKKLEEEYQELAVQSKEWKGPCIVLEGRRKELEGQYIEAKELCKVLEGHYNEAKEQCKVLEKDRLNLETEVKRLGGLNQNLKNELEILKKIGKMPFQNKMPNQRILHFHWEKVALAWFYFSSVCGGFFIILFLAWLVPDKLVSTKKS